MSTKGLMAHKKVAELTLNASGKADTLMLLPPWLYNGERGPFKLANVEHGHQIVKGATSDGSSAPKPKAKAAKPTYDPAANSPHTELGAGAKHGNPPETRHDDANPRGHELFIYRWERSSPVNGHTIAGWFRSAQPKTEKSLIKNFEDTWGHNSMREPVDSYTDWKIWRWTKAMQRAAIRDQTMGCPWGGEQMASRESGNLETRNDQE